MKPMFSEEGLASLDQFMRPGTLYLFDFDGTLVPIAEEPNQVRLAPRIFHRLISLSEYAPVGIISGRAVSDVRMRLAFEPAYIIGNHGMEGTPGWHVRPAYASMCLNWQDQLRAQLRELSDAGSGIWIENKRYSLTVHYRAAAHPDAAAVKLASLFEKLTPAPRVVAGKCVFNLVPPDALDKGRALTQLLQFTGAPGAIYVGDDITDEDVFRLRRPDILSIRVEPVEDSSADFYLHGQDDIASLLDALIGKLRVMTHANRTGKEFEPHGDIGSGNDRQLPHQRINR